MMERRGFLGRLLAGAGLGFMAKQLPSPEGWQDFGPGTPAILHGQESVTPSDGWMYYIDAATGAHYRVRKI